MNGREREHIKGAILLLSCHAGHFHIYADTRRGKDLQKKHAQSPQDAFAFRRAEGRMYKDLETRKRR
jgi:hypothetical protein